MKRPCPPGMEHTVAEADRQIANAIRRHGGNVTDHIERLRHDAEHPEPGPINEHPICKSYQPDLRALLAERDRLAEWVSDLQSGMYVNCVYCGHRYGPGETTPVTMADALKEHIAQCAEHPLSKVTAERDALAALLAEAEGVLKPFASAVSSYAWPTFEHGSHLITRELSLCVNDLRAARNLLSKLAAYKGESDGR